MADKSMGVAFAFTAFYELVLIVMVVRSLMEGEAGLFRALIYAAAAVFVGLLLAAMYRRHKHR